MLLSENDNVRLMSLTILTFLYSFKLLLLVVIKTKYKFWKISNLFIKIRSFHQKVLYQRIDSGTIFFIGLGLLYFLFTLFWIFSLAKPMEEPFYFDFRWVEVYLLFRFILFPIFKLFKLKRNRLQSGFGNYGNHFSEVSDKLITFTIIKS
jgi:hypothetical protein